MRVARGSERPVQRWRPVAARWLALAAVVLLGRPALTQVHAQTVDGGIACPLPHPAACYAGSTGAQLLASTNPQMALASVERDPISVTLLCFSAEGKDGQVHLEWQTATELGTSGFYLVRSLQEQGPYETISEFIFHCDDSGLVGGYYTFEDTGLTNGQSYYYKLVEVVGAQETIQTGPVGAMPIRTDPTLTLTPSLTATPNENVPQVGDAQPAWTWTPSATSTPTATQNPGSQATTPPTPTPSPTGAGISSADQIIATPSPAADSKPAATNTPLPSATRRATGVSLTAPAAGREVESGSPTPDVVAQLLAISPAEAGTILDVRALATPEVAPYPLFTSTPYTPEPYVAPRSTHTEQLATMTPGMEPYLAPSEGQVTAAQSPTPRVWLVAGFLVSLLILLLALVALFRFGRR